jgi:DNA-damage-inducible protein D
MRFMALPRLEGTASVEGTARLRGGSMSQQPDFDSIKQENVYGIEYWRARDLMPLLGYGKNWRNFLTAIEKAKIACQENGYRVEDHFDAGIKMVSIGSGTTREVEDYLLSRLACYLVAMNGNPRKPEIAAAQNYFAVSTRANEIHQLREEQEKRLAMRLKVSESYKQLAEIAYQSGVNSETFGIFVDAGYLGLHRHTVEELKQLKGIPEKEDYLDNITRAELSAIDFKNVQTEERLKNAPVSGLDEASQAHYFIGDQVRKAIEAMHGPMPEDLPSAESIRKMVEERRRKQKRIAKNKPSDEQDTLF